MTSEPNNRDKVEEIKNALDIVDVIGKTVSLRRESNGSYAGATSPTSKSGASLKVDKSKQCWHNFATGEKGDVFDWIGHENRLDVRGAGFPEVLRIAADLAGIELADMTEEERDTAKEKADIHNLYTEAVEIYHQNLTPELYSYLKEKWGIAREMADRLKIGYATKSRDLKDLDVTTLKKSGLVYVNNGMTGGEVFTGRIIFPYWKNGKVVYLIGRQTKETPQKKDGSEPSKYQKLLVHSDKFPYVSPAVQNSYFYGEDSLRGSDYCIITEGVADCITMLQAGFPCISPVTVQFREKDHPKLLSLTKGLNRVYICNDNEANQAGLKGALSTAEALENAVIETRLIILPRPEGLDKIDIADYMKDHSPEDFKGLIDSSVRLWEFKLNQCVIPASANSLDRLRAFKAFISNDLHLMQADEWGVFVNNEVPEKFHLTKKDVKKTVEGVTEERVKKWVDEDEQPEEHENEQDDQIREYPAKIREAANDILENGDAFDFILKKWNTLHVGDKNIGEHLLCSIGATMIPNTRLGLHMKPSGATGTGKSDAMEYMLELLPTYKYITGSLSSKVLFYDESLKTGAIVYTDDAKIEGDIIVTLRALTSNYQKETVHRTLDGDLKVNVRKIPPRVTIWMSSCDSIPDEQLQTRFCLGDTDESTEQDSKVNDNQKKRATRMYSENPEDDILTCRCIFDTIFQNECAVYAPLVDAIEWNDKPHRRNFDKFLDMLFSVTLYNFRQREKVHGGIVSTLKDFDRAVEVYNGTAANNACNLNGKEMAIMKVIQASPGRTITFTELQEKTGIKETNLRYTMNGRTVASEGLLGKVKGLSKLDKTDSVGSADGTVRTSTKSTVYKYTGDLFELNSKLFQSVATIDRGKAERLTREFVSSDTENTHDNHNSHTTLTNGVRDENNCSKDNNNNNSTKITNNEKNGADAFTHINENACISQQKDNGNSYSGIMCESCESCSDLGQPITNDDVIYNVSALTTKSTGNEKYCEPNTSVSAISRNDLETNSPIPRGHYNHAPDGMRTYSNVDEKKMDPAMSELLRKALKKYAWDEYNGIVESIPVMVGKFNERTPEYKQRLGLQAVLDNAERLSSRGWK